MRRARLPRAYEGRTHTQEVTMRRVIMTATAAFVAGGIATGAALSLAQPAPPPAPGAAVMPTPHAAGAGWRGHDGRQQAAGAMHRMRTFALFFRQQDRALSPADVQKIAEAFLLWN